MTCMGDEKCSPGEENVTCICDNLKKNLLLEQAMQPEEFVTYGGEENVTCKGRRTVQPGR